jgi:ribosomal protein L40E
MQSFSSESTAQCLHPIELIPLEEPSEAAFCDFVCQFISLDCPRDDICIEQPCANFPLCGNLEPQWLLHMHGGLCQQPCGIFFGRVFEFSSFAEDEACPICLETGGASMMYQCEHMICAKCYGRSAFSATVMETLKRCPICRLISKPRVLAVMHADLLA